jgi:hypothetical protein
MEGRDKPHSDIYKEIINGWSHDAVCLECTRNIHTIIALQTHVNDALLKSVE